MLNLLALLFVFVFISHSRIDDDIAAKIAADLEKAGCIVWWDGQLHGGDQWVREIERNIDQATVVVTIVSPAAERSEWVLAERLRAKRKRKRLVPVWFKEADWSLPIEPLHAIAVTEVARVVDCRPIK